MLYLLLTTPFAAAGGAVAAAEEPGHKQQEQYVDLQPVGVPIVVDGQLLNYVFVNVRLNLSAQADSSRWRAQEPYFRDVLVRTAYGTPFALPGSLDKIDSAKLTATLLRQACAITGPGVIRSVIITQQAPSRRTRGPRA